MPAAIPSAVPDALFGYQMHQVAIFCPGSANGPVAFWTDAGFTNWIEDNAVLVGELTRPAQYPIPAMKLPGSQAGRVHTQARMLFNYDIMPMELEFLEYHGPSRWDAVGSHEDPFISHVSTYVDDVIWETKRVMGLTGEPPFHRFITTDHTNPGVVGKKRFIESIFDLRSIMGFDLKLIQKVDWDYPDEAWLGQEF